METWQDRARKYIEWKDNPLSNIYSPISKYRDGLNMVNTTGLSEEDRELLNRAFNPCTSRLL